MTGVVLIVVNVALTVFLSALALSIGVKAGRRAASREAGQLRRRLDTVVHVLAPLPEARRRDGAYFLYGPDLALLAVLIELELRDAENPVALDSLFRPDSGPVDR
ncbi:hypothetical protein [Streptosporangium roseum]|uniref:hypothetical protein n=1 Tax=Streptosporangium roseum TaxID=2001 RepID=UPI003319AE05